MANEENFCLKWSDFESNLSKAFSQLKNDEDFFDVTLACDGNMVQAHKVILSACSPYFRYLLKSNKHSHPLLYLKGVKYEEIKSLLDFMYDGEVSIAQDQLSSFLSVAEDLQVKGLAKNQHSTPGKASAKRPCPDQSQEMPSNTKPPKQAKTGTQAMAGSDPISEKTPTDVIIPNVKSESIVADVDLLTTAGQAGHQIIGVKSELGGFNSQNIYQEQMRQLTQCQGWTAETFSCPICQKTYANQYSLNTHMQTHNGSSYCIICNKNLSSPAYLKTHMAQLHQLSV